MARDPVYRRLAKTRQSPIEADDVMYDRGPASPEQILWLAVIERAMLDYITPKSELRPKYKHGLDTFFFEIEAKPWNLAYICNFLFETEDVAIRIRKRVLNLKADDCIRNFKKARKLF